MRKKGRKRKVDKVVIDGKKMSVGEGEFALLLKSENIDYASEFTFCPGRRWRFDFAWPDLKIAVEIEGMTYTGVGYHQNPEDYGKDCEKYNTAAFLGWKVFRFTRKQIGTQIMMQVLDLVRPCSRG